MAKRILLIIFIVFSCMFWGEGSFAQSQFSPMISKMENSLFGMDYNNQNDDSRLKRIEEVVYGKPSTGDVAQRVKKLSKDLAADAMGQEIKPKRDTFEDESDSIKEEVAPKADSNINYPIVDRLEDEVFKKEFKTMDINQRLANLEQKVFKKSYADDLNTRVDRLKGAVIRSSVAQNYDIYETGDFPSDSDSIVGQNPKAQDNYYSYNSPNAYNSNDSVLDDYQSEPDMGVAISALEQSILKKSFPNDTVSNRLSRMETKLFSTSFTDDDDQTRIDRISSANQAKKSAKKYDGNKTSQRAATAIQLGALLLMVLAFVL